MGRNPLVAATAVAVLVVAIVFIGRYFMGSDAPEPGLANWYDMTTGKLYGGFKVQEGGLPPITLPSGNEGVLARVYARGSCENKVDRFIGYLEKYTDEGKAMIIEAKAKVPMDRAALADAAMYERHIKRPDDPEWVLAGSDMGAEIREAVLGVTVCPHFVE